MGSHKHGVSGTCGRSSGHKQSMTRHNNREIEEARKQKQRHKQRMYKSIADLMARERT